MTSLQQSETVRQRTGWAMVLAYVNNPRPGPADLNGFDDPISQQASRDAVLWLGVNLVRGLPDEQARTDAYAAALRSAQDVLLRRRF